MIQTGTCQFMHILEINNQPLNDLCLHIHTHKKTPLEILFICVLATRKFTAFVRRAA